jgi:glucose/arabinose dehydrogenase
MIVAAVLAACGDAEPDLEEQVSGQLTRKTECGDLPSSAFRLHPDVAASGTLDVVDCGYRLPARLAFSPDGDLLLVAQLRGQLYAYVRDEGGALRLQPEPLFDLGDLGVRDEAGLSGVTFTADFDLAGDSVQRELFISYQRALDDGARNRVHRLRLRRDEAGSVVVEADAVIWTGSEPVGQAHQIQQGVAFVRAGEVHVLFAVGDANDAANAREPSGANGTLLMMRRDGRPPAGARPWPAHPYTQAIGHRNAYGITMLPADVDERRGVVGVENGNANNDRAWLFRVVDFDGDGTVQLDLGYDGDDEASSWTQARDPNTRGALGEGRNAVFRTFSPPVAPTSVAFHRGGVGPIPASSPGEASLVAGFFGESGSGSVRPGKNLQLLRLTNIEGAALQSSAQVLVERRLDTEGEFRHPVGLDVDPTDGSIWFADIISGDLHRVRFD